MPHASPTTGRRDQACVLMVENDPDARALFEYARQHSDVIFFVPSGGRALEQLRNIDYGVDAIVIDLMLGDMDGITLTEHIRRNESIRGLKPRLVFWYTGYPVNDTMMRAKVENKVTEIFMKPMDPTEVMYRVKGYLAGQQAAHGG